MSKVLVIGGNRFFGKRLVSLLLDRGAEVTLLNRGRLDDGFGNRVRRIRLDRSLLDRGHAALGRDTWDVVYDQACYDAPQALGACRAFEGRTPHYVFTSSASVYSWGTDIAESTFDARAHAFDPSYAYGNEPKRYAEGKRQAEAAFAHEAQFEVTSVRFPVVMGEDDYTERLKWHVDRVAEGKEMLFVRPQSRKTFVHAADAAGFLAALADRPLPGPVNVCAREPVSIRRIIELIEKRVDRAARIKLVSPDYDGEGEGSPYNLPDDWIMRTDKLRAYGYECAPVESWLAGLIDYYASMLGK